MSARDRQEAGESFHLGLFFALSIMLLFVLELFGLVKEQESLYGWCVAGFACVVFAILLFCLRLLAWAAYERITHASGRG